MISKCNVEVGLQSLLTKIGILVLQNKSCMTIFDYFNNYYDTKDSILILAAIVASIHFNEKKVSLL
jgi:hypothetical protein